MNKLLLSLLCVLALFAAVVPCMAAPGTLAEERVVNLPNDQGKWYVSVVGNANDARYNEILGWFESNPSLHKLKSQVHFCAVTTDMAIYKERYAKNVKGVPTVRVQKANGGVVYEAAGKNIPMTADGLNGALFGAVQNAQGIRPILPWRRGIEEQCSPAPNPGPSTPPPPETGPDVAPPVDDGGPPVMEPTGVEQSWLLAPLCGGMLFVGICFGYGRKLYEKLVPVVK